MILRPFAAPGGHERRTIISDVRLVSLSDHDNWPTVFRSKGLYWNQHSVEFVLS